MHKDGGNWRYNFLYLDVEAPVPQQVRPLGGCRCIVLLPLRKHAVAAVWSWCCSSVLRVEPCQPGGLFRVRF